MKRVIFCILLLMTAALLLTGCHEEWGLRITIKNAPEYENAGIYLPDDDGNWRNADTIRGVSVTYYRETGVLLLSANGSREQYISLCEQYKVCRIALLNKDGTPLHFSEDIQLAQSDKAGSPRDMTYDCANGQVTVQNWFAKPIFGRTPDGWLGILLVTAWGMLVPAAIVLLLLAAFVQDDAKRKISENITQLAGSIPAMLYIAFRIFMRVSPRLNLDGDPLTFQYVIRSFLMVFPWIPVWIYLICDTAAHFIKQARKN